MVTVGAMLSAPPAPGPLPGVVVQSEQPGGAFPHFAALADFAGDGHEEPVGDVHVVVYPITWTSAISGRAWRNSSTSRGLDALARLRPNLAYDPE
jgi:hypothetical protein